MKKVILLLLPIFLVGASLSASPVNAAGNPLDNIVQFISQKFNLNQNTVQTAVEQYRSDNQHQREEERLTQLVKDGKLTQAQKDVLLPKLDEYRSRQYALRTEFENWAKSAGIDLNAVMFGPGKMEMGYGMRRGR